MKYDDYGQPVIDSDTLFSWLYQDPTLNFDNIKLVDPEQYNNSISQLHLSLSRLSQYKPIDIPITEFDHNNQSTWFIPQTYQDFDITQWLIDQCHNDDEKLRVAQELLEYDKRNLMPLLTYLKYLVDTMRANNIVWGVGRGSSVASYVLYKIGVHKIDSMKFNLNISEFLKGGL